MSSRDIRPVNRGTLYQEAVEEIRAAVLRGAFHPGDRLEEPSLARSLDLSRGPVREALRHLEREGLVTSSPHRGAVVVSLNIAEIKDLLAIRECVETLNSDLIVARVNERDLTDLRALVQKMTDAVRAGEPSALGEAEVQFHRRLILIGSSSIVMRVWESLMTPLRLYLTVSDVAYLQQVGDVAATHVPILQALEARDPSRLREAIREHIAETYSILRQRAKAESQHTPSQRTHDDEHN
jgi:DNA-binding GntR family transcriptional regulator